MRKRRRESYSGPGRGAEGVPVQGGQNGMIERSALIMTARAGFRIHVQVEGGLGLCAWDGGKVNPNAGGDVQDKQEYLGGMGKRV